MATSAGGSGAMVRYCGEERTRDAVYAVYLRKVRYVPPHALDHQTPRYRALDPDGSSATTTAPSTADPGTSTSHPPLPTPTEMGVPVAEHMLQWESIKERQVRAATPEKLVESLIGPDDLLDGRHFNIFFATFRAFITPQRVLELVLESSGFQWELCLQLISRFERLEEHSAGSTSALVIQNSIRSILVCWLDMYPEDFYSDDADLPLLTRLVDFARTHRLSDVRTKSRKLREHLRRVQEDGGLWTQVASLRACAQSLGYPGAREQPRLFDIGRHNCRQIAEQLTFWDAALFKDVLLEQCVGSVWGRRARLPASSVFSVKATVDHFNVVTQRVMTSVVLPECRADFRAKIVAKWIEIARELRSLKNRASLKAVLSALQAEPVHRLRSCWGIVSARAMALFQQLAAEFEADDEKLHSQHQEKGRRSDTTGVGKSPLITPACRRTKSDVNLAECQGQVPYLGSYLTELAMIHHALPDTTEDGLVNFEKHVREWDVLARLRLFQSAARAYKISMDPDFCDWFYHLPALDEHLCFARSLEIEKPPNGSLAAANFTPEHGRHYSGSGGTPQTPKKKSPYGGQGEGTSASTSARITTSADSGCSLSDGTSDGTAESGSIDTHNHHHLPPPLPTSKPPLAPGTRFTRTYQAGSQSLSRSATPSLRREMAKVVSERRTEAGGDESPTTSNGEGASHQQPQSPPTFHLARVGLDETLQGDTAAGTNYKCIKIEESDRMHELIARVLDKHLLDEESPAHFSLVQLLPSGDELELPQRCAPFYALAPDPCSPMLSLVLRRRPDAASPSGHSSNGNSLAPSAKKLNKLRRTNLLRWSSGFL